MPRRLRAGARLRVAAVLTRKLRYTRSASARANVGSSLADEQLPPPEAGHVGVDHMLIVVIAEERDRRAQIIKDTGVVIVRGALAEAGAREVSTKQISYDLKRVLRIPRCVSAAQPKPDQDIDP